MNVMHTKCASTFYCCHWISFYYNNLPVNRSVKNDELQCCYFLLSSKIHIIICLLNGQFQSNNFFFRWCVCGSWCFCQEANDNHDMLYIICSVRTVWTSRKNVIWCPHRFICEASSFPRSTAYMWRAYDGCLWKKNRY